MPGEAARLTVNVLGVNAGWFACVLGAAHGVPWLGPLVVLGLLVLQVHWRSTWRSELRLVLVCGVVGFTLDSALIACGLLEARRALMPPPLTTIWLVALWVNLALVLDVALRRLQDHLLFAALLGAVGGPAAYLGGEGLGAVALLSPRWLGLVVLATAWAGVMPLLLWFTRRLRPAHPL